MGPHLPQEIVRSCAKKKKKKKLLTLPKGPLLPKLSSILFAVLNWAGKTGSVLSVKLLWPIQVSGRVYARKGYRHSLHQHLYGLLLFLHPQMQMQTQPLMDPRRGHAHLLIQSFSISCSFPGKKCQNNRFPLPPLGNPGSATANTYVNGHFVIYVLRQHRSES